MTRVSKLAAVALLGVCLIAPVVSAADQGLFVNLTSSDLDRASMAIFIAQKALAEKGAEATLFLNVDGIRLADKRLPSPGRAGGATLHEMLRTFMQAGGRVYACPMCMQNVGGMSEQDLIAGIQVATMDAVWSALFAKDVRVLSY